MKRPDADTRASLQAKAGTEQAAHATNGATTSPTVGTIAQRDKHPACKRLVDLHDEETAAMVLCDEHLPLVEALERTWSDDRHLILYRLDADPQGDEFAFARVSKRSPFVGQLEQAGGRVRVPVLVFDHDLPKVSGEKQEWTNEALDTFAHETLARAVESHAIPEPTAFYTTLHGSRFIYVLDEEVSQLDAEAMARGLIAQFAKAGIELDDACTDWTRLFRLPRTVRQDSGEAYEPDILLIGGPALRVASCPRIEAAAGSDSFAKIDPYVGEMPDSDEVRELLEKEGKNGRIYPSDLVKKAEQFLVGRRAFDVVFKDAPIAEGEEGWNNQVTKIVGQTVGMLARQDEATPEGIYALLHSAVEQLQYREDNGARETNWYEKTWDLTCRMWANEEAQIIAERQEREAKVAEAKAHREKLIEQVKEARPQDVPEDPAEAEEWFTRRMIASDGRRHHVMNRLGTYNTRPVPDSLLIPMIRELDMEEVIPTTEIRGKTIAQRSATAIINDHATPITSIECSSRDDVAYIDGPAGHKVLHIPVHRLNPRLTPGGVFDKRVDQWLQALGGEKYDQLIEWLSHSLNVKRAICALNLYGSPGTGKGMLAAGLAECFEGEQRNDGRALGKFNVGLLDSPIVNCDEGVPKISSDEALTVDQAFRSMVTGGRITIRAMHRDPFNAGIYPRIMFTSNDREGTYRDLSGGRLLTADDIEAIELRLLSIETGDAARVFLTERGNFSWTNGWVAGAERSRYVLANHILYLYENRKPAPGGSNRLLVEGEAGTFKVRFFRESKPHLQGAKDLARELARSGDVTQRAVNAANGAGRPLVHLDGVRLFVTAGLFEPGAAGRMDRLDRPEGSAIVTALERSGVLGPVTVARKGGRKSPIARWRQVDLAVLREYVDHIEDLDVSAVEALDRRLGELN